MLKNTFVTPSVASQQDPHAQNSTMFTIKRCLSVGLLFIVLAFVGYLSTVSILIIDMNTVVENDRVQVYWANEKDGYSEEQSAETRVKQGRHNYWFLIDHFNKSTRLRVDPVTQATQINIYQIKLYSLQYFPLDIDLFNDAIKSNELEVSGESSASNMSDNALLTLGEDPYAEFRLVYSRSDWVVSIFLLFIAGILIRKKNYLHIGLIFSGLILAYYLLSFNATRVSFRVEAEQASKLTVFWRDVDENISSTKAQKVPIFPGNHRYTVEVGNISNAEVVYIEKRADRKDILIDQLVFKEPGYKDFYYSDTTENIVKQGDAKGLLISVVAFLAAYFLVLWVVSNYLKSKRFYAELFPGLIKIAFLLAALQVINLAWEADYNIHPDEDAHIESIKYYSQYWDPPTVGDERALDSYQDPWAFSRLNDLGISYFLAGKFRSLIQVLFVDESFIARAFNAFLFLMFFVMSRDKRCLLFLVPLLCSPQIWYLYAYANRGGFVLFVSILLAWQLANKKSALNIYLYTGKCLDNYRYALLPGVLLGILSIEQTNYSLFILFVLSVLLWKLLFFVEQKKVFIYKCLFFLLIAVSVFSARYAIDVSINGTNKLEQKLAYAEEHAELEFKPSLAATSQSYWGLRLRDKGVKISEIFQYEWQWHKRTFKSFVGFYGGAEYSPRWYYAYFALIYGIVLMLMLKHAIFGPDIRYKLFTVLTLTALFGGVLMGVLFSWLYDFQPQGRYIFPIFPIMLVYFWEMFPRWSQPEKALILSCAIVLIVLSFYSFNEVALNYLFA